MANRVTIDVEARFIDNVTSPAGQAERAVSDVTREVNNLNNRRARPRIDANTSDANRNISSTQRLLNRLDNSKFKTKLEAIDNASKKIEKVTSAARSLAGKTWTTMVKIKDYATTPLTKIKNALFNIKTLVAAVTAGMAANQFIAKPIALADQYSSAKIGFSTLLGAERGQQMMDDLDKFAKETPFQTSGVIAASQKMLAMGWNAEDIIADMKTIGDAAAATGKGTEGLDRITLALSQIRSKGKLSTEELNQLAEAGISAKRYIAEGLGYGSGDEGLMKMTKDLEGGKIGAEAGIKAIIEGMKEYDGMMNKTANETVEGLKSQIEDTFEINIFRRWGQGLQDGAKKGLGSIVQLLDTAEDGLKSLGDTLYDVGKTISNYFAKVLENTVDRVKKITESTEFQNASIGEKINMLWEGAIKNPFSDWWSNTVVPWWDSTMTPWLADKAKGIGKTIGSGLTGGLLALLGVDPTGIVGDGISIGGEFARGFAEGFDGGAITEALVNAIKNVWSALPAWAQMLIGGYGAAKAFTGVTSLISGGIGAYGNILGALGATGNSMVRGSGILGGLASAGYSMTGGAANAAGYFGLAGGMSGTAAALTGLGGIAGGAVGLGATISGINDLVNSYNNTKMTQEQRDASAGSGALKIGGALSGAAAGAMIGSVVPVVGTLLGGLIGAGIGGLGGILGGNAMKNKATKNATNAELLAQQESEDAQKELERRQKLMNESIAESFGTIKLSADEISEIIDNIVIGDKAKGMEKFATAAEEAKTALGNVQNSAGKLNRMNWKAALGFKFSDEDKQSYTAAVEEFITNAESAIEAEHYKVNAAVDLLLDDSNDSKKGIISGMDSYFATLQSDLDSSSKELQAKVALALKDGVIDADEQQIIEQLQNKVSEITNKFNQAQEEAGWEALKIKFSGANIDYESFQELQNSIATQMESSVATQDEALTASITSLKLQLNDGAIDQAEYDKQVKALTEGYTANITELKANASSIQFEIAGDSYKDLFPEGSDPAAILKKALDDSLADGIEPMNWTTEQASQYLGVDNLGDGAALALGNILSAIEVTLPTNQHVQDEIAKATEITEGTSSNIATATTSKVKTAIDTGLNALGTFSKTVDINITTNPKVTNPGAVEATVKATNQARGGIWGAGIPGYSNGGFVQGGGKIVRVAEEGTPEAIIPLGSQRRERGLKLWEKAGAMLGVPGFATGGIVGDADEGIRFAAAGSTDSVGGQDIQIEVGGITFEINMPEGTTDVSAAIKAQAEEIAETVAGVLYNSFSAQFQNTPLRGR